VNTSRSTPVTTLDTEPWIMFTSLVMRLINSPVGVRSSPEKTSFPARGAWHW